MCEVILLAHDVLVGQGAFRVSMSEKIRQTRSPPRGPGNGCPRRLPGTFYGLRVMHERDGVQRRAKQGDLAASSTSLA